MANQAPPTIFSPARRAALRRRIAAMQALPDAPHYLLDDMVEDVQERLGFLRHAPEKALVIGDWGGTLAPALAAQGCTVTCADSVPFNPTITPDGAVLDEEAPFPFGGFGLIASLGTLDTVNDLPGALIHIRNALAPGGLAIVSFPGAGSLPALRGAMLAGDGERPAARIHPMVDVRAGGQLLQRCGFASPVVDSRRLGVRFSSMRSLVADLRAQGLTSALASTAPPLTRSMVACAESAFTAQADADGRVTEQFEILTLSGWHP